MQRLHEVFQLIEHIVDGKPEANMVNAAMTIPFELKRRQIRTVFKDQRSTDHD
jgi:hypothetical protein